TKPSRSRSYGRDAGCGESFRVERARIEANPPMPSLQMTASAPATIITSASPRRICQSASPIECALEVQAVTLQRFGPLRSRRIETIPEARFVIDWVTKNGVIRL